MSNPIQLSKTVYIGLGGTGAKALLKTKAMMLENYGEIPPMIKFHVYDTDTSDKVSMKDINGNVVSFSESTEFTHIKVPNVKRYVEANPEICASLPTEILSLRDSITAGAGQFRALGRLALLKSFDTDFGTTIGNIVEDVKNWAVGINSKYSVNTEVPTTIVVVFSVAGGTGAGAFIDFPLYLKNYLKLADSNEVKLIAVGMLPDVYSSLGVLAKNCPSNAYTGLREYEFLSDYDKFNGNTNFLPEQPISTGKYSVNSSLYDMFILVNNKSRKYNFNKIDEMTSFIGRSVYLMSGRTGGIQDSVLDNVAQIDKGKLFKNKERSYFGMGSAELLLETEKVAEYYSLTQIDHLVQYLKRGIPSIVNFNNDVQDKINEWQIMEDQKADQVISIIHTEDKYNVRFGNLDSFEDDESESFATKISKKRDTYISSKKADLNTKIYGTSGIAGSLSELNGAKLALLQGFVTAKLKEDGGLRYSTDFLNSLIGRLNAMLEEMNNEKKQYDEQIEEKKLIYSAKESDIRSAEAISKWNVFKSRSKAIEEACSEYVEVVNSEVTLIYERERRIAAALFYKTLLEKCGTLLTSINNFKNQLDSLTTRVGHDLQTIRNRNSLDPHVIYLNQEIIDVNKIGNEQEKPDVQGFLKYIDLVELIYTGCSIDEIFERFKAYTSSLDRFKEILNTNILDELNKLDYEVLDKLVKRLKDAVSVMRTYDDAQGLEVAEMSTIGVHNNSHSSLKHSASYERAGVDDAAKVKKLNLSDAFNNHFTYNGRPPEYSNTYDRKRIVAGQYQSGIPVFAVNDFRMYKINFDKQDDRDKANLTANKYWNSKMNELNYSIFPGSNSESSMKAWVLSIIATKIEEDANRRGMLFYKEKMGNYFIFSEKGVQKNKTTMIDLLHSDRKKAFDVFKDINNINTELLNIIKSYYRNNQDLYNKTFKRFEDDQNPIDIEIYVNEFARHGLSSDTYNSPSYSQSKNLVEEEFKYIKDFVKKQEYRNL